jgi:hypothetical protein
VQEVPGQAVLQVVPGEGFSTRDAEGIRRSLNQKLAGSLTFDIRLCDEIPLTRNGKATYVDQRIKRNQPSDTDAIEHETGRPELQYR